MRQKQHEEKEYIKNIVEYTVLGKCVTCFGKPLNRFCVTCNFCNGVSRKEAIENNWTIDKILSIAEQRKIL